MKKILFILILLINTNLIFSQNLEVKWSEKLDYKKNEDGYFSKYIESNDQFIYALFTNNPMDGKVKAMKVVAFDKNTMTKVSSVAIIGFSENAVNKAIYSKLTYFKTVIQNESVYVFWIKADKQTEELYIEKFDIKLNRIKELTKLSTNTISAEFKKSILARDATSFVVLENKKGVIIGQESPQVNGFTKFKYSALDANMNLSEGKEIILPIKLEGSYSGLSSEYFRLENGDILIKNYIPIDPQKNMDVIIFDGTITHEGINVSHVFTLLKTNTSELSTVKFNLKDKVIRNITFVLTNDFIKIYGVSCDSKNIIEGLAFAKIDMKTLQQFEVDFIKLDSKILDQLYDNKNDNLKKYDSENNATIKAMLDFAFPVDESNMILSFSTSAIITLSPTSNALSGGTKTHQKDIILIKLSDQNQIIWNATIKRSIYYYAIQYFKDIAITLSKDKMILMYGEDSLDLPSILGGKSSEIKDQIGCASVDIKTGAVEQKKIELNSENESNKKMIYIPSIEVFDSKFYTNFCDLMLTNKEGFLGVLKPM